VEGLVAAAALALLLAAFLFLVPPRPSLTVPSLALALYLLFLLVRSQLDPDAVLGEVLFPLSLFCVTACLGHTALILVTRLLLRRQESPWPVDLFPVLLGAVYFVAVLVLLAAAGLRVGHLGIAVAGVAALLLVIGKEPLRQVAAGVSLRSERLFAPEDWIQVGEEATAVVGKVLYLGWRTTTLVTPEGTEILVPNSSLAERVVRRFPKQEPWTARRVSVVCPSDVAPNQVRKVLADCLRDCPSVCQEPPPLVLTEEFTDYGIAYSVHFRLKEFEPGATVDSTVRTLIWYALDRQHIPLAVPQRRLRVHTESPEAAARAESDLAARRGRALRQIPLVAELSDDVVTQLAAAARSLWFTRGETVVRQGDEGDEMFLILTGEVSVTVQEGDGREVEMRHLKAGQFFGEMSLLTGARRSATVRAVQDCELLVLAKNRFGPVLEKNADLVAAIQRALEARQADQAKRLEEFRASKQSGEANDSLVARFKHNFKLGW
jgi:small-conductance mechanosensitive channel